MDSVTALHRELKGEWEKTPPNLRKCGNLLDELKVFHWNDRILSLLHDDRSGNNLTFHCVSPSIADCSNQIGFPAHR